MQMYYYHVVIDEKQPKHTRIKVLDPRKIKKLEKKKKVIKPVHMVLIRGREYFVYNEKGFIKDVKDIAQHLTSALVFA